MECEYYILWYQLDSKNSYLIWFSTDEQDGVFVNKRNIVPSFDTIEALRQHAELKEINLKEEEPRLINLDVVQKWLKEKITTIEDYNEFLDAWNLFEDVSKSISADFHKSGNSDIYERIFWGCNIPVITPEGESFTPTWTEKELEIIRETLSFGLQMFREKVKQI